MVPAFRAHVGSSATAVGDDNIAVRGKKATLVRSLPREEKALCGRDGRVLFTSTVALLACDKEMNLCFSQAESM